MSAPGVVFLVWFLGFLCGVAAVYSPRYRLALAAFMVSVLGMAALGVTAAPLALDLMIGVAFVLLCVGVAFGVMGLLWEPARKEAGK